MYPTTCIEDIIANAKDPSRLVVVEESPIFPGELCFQTLSDQEFLARYRDWVSRYLMINELFMTRAFVELLDKDGWDVKFTTSTKHILENYVRYERNIEIEGFQCPGGGQLYPYQTFTLQRALERATRSDSADRLFFIGWTTGSGKAEPVSEPVLTPTGWRTMGDLQVGDYVIGSNGCSTRVVGVFPQGIQPVHRIEMNDGTFVRANADHLWSVRKYGVIRRGPTPSSPTRKVREYKAPWKVLSTKEIALGIGPKARRWQLPALGTVLFRDQESPLLDPYLLGVYLGDGTWSDGSLSTDRWILEALRRPVQAASEGHAYHAKATVGVETKKKLADLGLAGLRSWEKFVPSQYLVASPEDRLALLQGLLDTDGSPDPGKPGVEYSTTSPFLLDAVADLVRGLGGKATVACGRITKYTDAVTGERIDGRESWRIYISMTLPPFRLPRKLDRWHAPTKYLPVKTIVSVVDEGVSEEQVCIVVDAPDNLYVTRGHTITHNSLAACSGAQELFNRDQIDLVLCFTMMKMKANFAYAATASFAKTTKLDWCLSEGTKKQRYADYDAQHQVYVLNYEKCWADFDALKKLTQGRRVLWIADEAHRLVTSETDHRKRTKTRKHWDRLVTGCHSIVWPMSASVVSNNPLRYRDVYNLAGGEAKNPLSTVTDFVGRYTSQVRHIPLSYYNEIVYYEWNLAKLHEVRHRVAARTQSARKTDPGVREFFKGNTTEVIPVQMSKEDRKLYDTVCNEAYAARQDGDPLIGYYRLLRYICNTPLTLNATSDPLGATLAAEHPKLVTNSHCSKLEMFLDQLEAIQEQEDKVIAFTSWTNLSLLLLAPEVKKRGINHVLHYGVGQKEAESRAAQHIFKTDPAVTLFFSSDAGAHGLNLPEARYNISYECPYSFDLLMQRSERNNRADSQFDTTTYIYVTENSVEERIYDIMEERRKLAASTLGTSETLSYGSSRANKSEEANLNFLIWGED